MVVIKLAIEFYNRYYRFINYLNVVTMIQRCREIDEQAKFSIIQRIRLFTLSLIDEGFFRSQS